MANLTDMLSKFVTSNTASTSGLGTVPSNTVTNPKEDLKGITTRSGVAYQGPMIPSTSSSSPKVMNRDTEVTKDKVLPTNNGGLARHLEYAYLEKATTKFPVIKFAKDLKIRKSSSYQGSNVPQRDIAWKLSDIKVLDPEFVLTKPYGKRTTNQQFRVKDG
ncbi:hypothetical protein Tco_0824961 [Tanacetum coccineum]